MIERLDNKDDKVANNILSVFRESYAIEAKLLNATDFPPLKRPLEKYIHCNNQFWGFLKANELVAIIEIDHSPTTIHIQSLVVLPTSFRQGIAGKLVEFALNKFDSKLFTVETGVKNIPATDLYKKYNFKEVKQWDTDNGVRKVRLER